MPVGRIAVPLRIGGIQIVARQGTLTTRSNSSISFSGVIPGRHSSRGLKRIVVSNISSGAGSVALSARPALPNRSEEHTSELQSLMRISYAVFCLKKKNNIIQHYTIVRYRNLNKY